MDDKPTVRLLKLIEIKKGELKKKNVMDISIEEVRLGLFMLHIMECYPNENHDQFTSLFKIKIDRIPYGEIIIKIDHSHLIKTNEEFNIKDFHHGRSIIYSFLLQYIEAHTNIFFKKENSSVSKKIIQYFIREDSYIKNMFPKDETTEIKTRFIDTQEIIDDGFIYNNKGINRKRNK